jgi:hypothetical protein
MFGSLGLVESFSPELSIRVVMVLFYNYLAFLLVPLAGEEIWKGGYRHTRAYEPFNQRDF